jgi:cellulose synthase (UDP-forming)
VTPKGSGNEDSAFDPYTFACVSVLIAATALGLFINIVPEWSRIGQGDFSVVSVYWALVNIAVLVIAALICFEKAKPLQDSFDADETAYLTAGGRRTAVRLVSISLDRVTLEWPPGAPPPPADILLEMSGVEPLPARIVAPRSRGHRRPVGWSRHSSSWVSRATRESSSSTQTPIPKTFASWTSLRSRAAFSPELSVRRAR